MTGAVIDAILADPLAAARGAPRAIGYVGFDIPIDLLLAPGFNACHLPWRTDGPFPFADRWLESSFPGWSRSMLEDWAQGRFDCFEAVVFTRGDDAAQRLYYYVCELQKRGLIRGPEPLLFDVARIPRQTSVDRTIHSVRQLATRLGLDEDGLRAGIAAGNRRRAAFEQLAADRRGSGRLYERISRASLFAPVEDAIAGLTPPAAHATGRILLAGSVPPDDRLHRMVEDAGWNVTGEANDLSLLRHGPVVQPGADAAAAIGGQAHRLPIGARSFGDRAARLIASARQSAADAVILWYVEEEEAQVWQLPAEVAALRQAGVPALPLTRRAWADEDSTQRDIASFLEGLTG
jgi:hypothetical protein